MNGTKRNLSGIDELENPKTGGARRREALDRKREKNNDNNSHETPNEFQMSQYSKTADFVSSSSDFQSYPTSALPFSGAQYIHRCSSAPGRGSRISVRVNQLVRR